MGSLPSSARRPLIFFGSLFLLVPSLLLSQQDQSADPASLSLRAGPDSPATEFDATIHELRGRIESTGLEVERLQGQFDGFRESLGPSPRMLFGVVSGLLIVMTGLLQVASLFEHKRRLREFDLYRQDNRELGIHSITKGLGDILALRVQLDGQQLESIKLLKDLHERLTSLEDRLQEAKASNLRHLLAEAERYFNISRLTFQEWWREPAERVDEFTRDHDAFNPPYQEPREAKMEILRHMRGVCAYLADDIARAHTLLRVAAVPFEGQDPRQKSYSNFYLAVLHAHFGHLSQADNFVLESLNGADRLILHFLLQHRVAQFRREPQEARAALDKAKKLLAPRIQTGHPNAADRRLASRIALSAGNLYWPSGIKGSSDGLSEGDLELALHEYEDAIKTDGGDYYAWLSVAQAREKLGKPNQDDYRKAYERLRDAGDSVNRRRELESRCVVSASMVLAAKGAGEAEQVWRTWLVRLEEDLRKGVNLRIPEGELRIFSQYHKILMVIEDAPSGVKSLVGPEISS